MPPTEPIANTSWCHKNRHKLLIGILSVCLVLRVWLAATGGQGYWPDEMRYSSASREAAWQFVNGSSRDAWIQLIGQADHLLFKIIGLPVAFVELKYGQSGTIAASWFGLFSVLGIWLIYAISRAAGAAAREALLAAFFAAGASSLFYYCRHFFPYDTSLFFCLFALWVTLKTKNSRESAVIGLAAGMGFLSYNGYWFLGGTVLVYHVLRGQIWSCMIRRAILSGIGLAAPIITAILAAKLLNRDLIASFLAFSRTITQGDFGIGWSLISEYLYSSEGFVLIGWLVLIFAGLILGQNLQRITLWLGFIIALYLTLILCSDVMRTFVVYGRTARILIPFLCLAAAAGLENLAGRWPSRLVWTIVLTTMLGASSANISESLRQVFPDDFIHEAKVEAQVKRLESPVLFRLLNVDRLWEGHVMHETRPHSIILRRTHPLQFQPYLYEGFANSLRTRYQKEDISMQLIAIPGLTLPNTGGGYTGPLKLSLKFPENRSGSSEPLFTSGMSQKANFIYVRYIDDTHVQFGYDCWGSGGPVSEPVKIDFKKYHELLLINEAQISPLAEAPPNLHPKEWPKLKGSVHLILNGTIVLAKQVTSHAVKPSSIMLGMNLLGGSSTTEYFSGEMQSIERLQWEEIQQLLQLGMSATSLSDAIAAASPDPSWKGYCGPLRLKLQFPLHQEEQTEPLIVTGYTGKGDFVYVRYMKDGRVRFGYDHWGLGGGESESVQLDQTRRSEVVISIGAMIPPKTDQIYFNNGDLGTLRENVVISVNGRVVLSTKMISHPALPSSITVGKNNIGGSSTTDFFSGEITSITSEPTPEIVRIIKGTK